MSNNNIDYKQLANEFIKNKQYNKVFELQSIWQDEQLSNNILVDGELLKLNNKGE
jgi:hypothetical protein